MNLNTEIVLLGNPSLRMTSEAFVEADFGSTELKQFSDHMYHMLEVHNGLGLAAPQLGINKRAFIFGMDDHANRKGLPIPFTLLINPSFKAIGDAMEEEYEGCLSIGPMRAKVPRYSAIYYSGYTIDGHLIEREVSGLHARVFQHEYDHLDGIVFLDKVTDYHSMGFHDELKKHGIF